MTGFFTRQHMDRWWFSCDIIFCVFPCVNCLLSTTKYINEGREPSVQLCPQLKSTISPQPIEKHDVADFAVLVQLLYIFYYAHLWLHVCMANTAVMVISHWDRWGQQLSTVLSNHFVLFNSRKVSKWFCFWLFFLFVCFSLILFFFTTAPPRFPKSNSARLLRAKILIVHC